MVSPFSRENCWDRKTRHLPNWHGLETGPLKTNLIIKMLSEFLPFSTSAHNILPFVFCWHLFKKNTLMWQIRDFPNYCLLNREIFSAFIWNCTRTISERLGELNISNKMEGKRPKRLVYLEENLFAIINGAFHFQ